MVSAPHSIANGLKRLLAVAAATEITFPAAEKTKAFLADPSAFQVAAPVEAVKEEVTQQAAVEESDEDSSDMDMGGMFDF